MNPFNPLDLLDVSNASDVPLTDRLSIGRRKATNLNPKPGKWFVYIDGVEPHDDIKPFDKFANALAYLGTDDGRWVLTDHGVEVLGVVPAAAAEREAGR